MSDATNEQTRPTNYDELLANARNTFARDLEVLNAPDTTLSTRTLHELHTLEQGAERIMGIVARIAFTEPSASSIVPESIVKFADVPPLDKIDLEIAALMCEHIANVSRSLAEHLRVAIQDAPEPPPFDSIDWSEGE